MAQLVDLPNELLEEILLLATRGDQECLREKWRRERKSEVALLALHLLRHPHHRSLVRTLEFNSLSSLHSVGRVPSWSPIAARVGLRPETLAELAEEAERTFPPDLASDWSCRIRNGSADASAAPILTWSTRVTEVEFALSPFTQEDDGLYLSDDEVYHSDDDEVEFTLPPPAREDDDMEHSNGIIIPIIPECGLTIEKLYLKDFEITGNGLWNVIGACRQLRVLNLDLNNSPKFFGSTRQMSNAILRQAGSIKEIHLRLHKWGVRWDDTQFLSDYEIPLDRCFARLSQLHTLTVDVKELLPSPEGPITPDFLVTRLPVSIMELTINWYTMEMGSGLETITIGTGEVDIWLGIVEALKVLLREARPGYKFSKLRYLDASEILLGSDELQKVVEIGESNGVHVENFSVVF
ncbi:hypothetical protein FCULG_00010595 [Fusarium culmorum]|uniref:F-box domain-containing protein n=1 Tax=Fusarium culmorum TaxID=5516 RepID=A0A2T4GCQ3_FUSCU|nr:hypothetical protein FCULG_00010595 [Fusarium culmorum]